MCKRIILAVAFAGIVQVTAGHSETLTIKVIDQGNKGVYSRVYYEDGTKPAAFFNTDKTGEVPQPPRDCGKMRTLYAHPFDSGSYFDSEVQPCAQKIVLRVLARQTPKGAAINYQIVPFTLPDGSPGVITVKAALESKFSDTSRAGGGQPQCQITLNAIADQHAFKIQGDTWVGLKQATTEFSNVFSSSTQPDQQTVTFPYSCDSTHERVQTLQALAADRLDSSVKNAVMLPKTLRSLGIQ